MKGNLIFISFCTFFLLFFIKIDPKSGVIIVSRSRSLVVQILLFSLGVACTVSISLAILNVFHSVFINIYPNPNEMDEDELLLEEEEDAENRPTESGDHHEFFDIDESPPVINGKASNDPGRRRRQRMATTLLPQIEWDRDPSRDKRRKAIQDSLEETENADFQTPLPSPRKTFSDFEVIYCDSDTKYTDQPAAIYFEKDSRLEYQDEDEETFLRGRDESTLVFTKSFYHLSPTLEDEEGVQSSKDSATIMKPYIISCNCEEDLMYVCTKCSREDLTYSPISAQDLHAYGLDEYFDDDFKEIKQKSYITDKDGESHLSLSSLHLKIDSLEVISNYLQP